MKHFMLVCLPIVLLFFYTPAAAALSAKKSSPFSITSVSTTSDAVATYNFHLFSSSGNLDMLPRGRGNGREAFKSFLFGWFSIFPVLGLICVPFAYIKGFRNTRRKRKGRGFAIAGIVLATIGLVFSIAILSLM